MSKFRRWVFLIYPLLGAWLGISTAIGQVNPQDSAIRINATLVNVPVIVSDREGRYIAGLKAEDFTLFEDNVKQQIAFFDAAEEPLNVALLLDTSKSTRFVLNDIKKAASSFLKELRTQDRAMVVSFDYKVEVLCPLTSDRKVLANAIEKAEVGEYVGTMLNDSISEVLEQHFRAINGRKAIILLTDGKDFGSRITASNLLYSIAESNTMIYPIYYRTSPPYIMRAKERPFFPQRRWRRRMGQPDYPLPDRDLQLERVERKNQQAIEFLEELSYTTAGRLYQSEVMDLQKVFKLIADELRHQYQLGFYPEGNRSEGSLHTIRVQVGRSDFVIRARRNYRVETVN